ncbi:MAG: hypothetical protein DPW16_10530 [Chloroflexi bacterium]|nr:hypothetical protein [Chloroflexota bacterium]
MLDSGLADVFHFDETDLQYNRQGVMSPTQSQKYAEMNKSCLQVSVVITLGFIALTVVLGLLLNEENRLPAIATLGVFSILSGLGTWFAYATRNDTYVMHQIEGEARLRTDSTENGRRYVVSISGYEFGVDPTQYEVVQDGASYRIYYAVPEGQTKSLKTASKQIQSLERLS